jgi:hypothetical protein
MHRAKIKKRKRNKDAISKTNRNAEKEDNHTSDDNNNLTSILEMTSGETIGNHMGMTSGEDNGNNLGMTSGEGTGNLSQGTSVYDNNHTSNLEVTSIADNGDLTQITFADEGLHFLSAEDNGEISHSAVALNGSFHQRSSDN